MINQTRQGPEKKRVRQSFNSAAVTYEAVAKLQNYAGRQMLERLELIKISPQTILDLGSGPGEFARHLSRQYSRAEVIELDIAENMLKASRAHRQPGGRHRFICADAESMPLARYSVDLVYSNLMLQWISHPDQLFSDLCTVIRPSGLFIFTSLGPDTLRELRDSWAAVDDATHVNTFLDMHDVGDALVRAGFSDPVMEVETVRLSYKNIMSLMHDLKQLGAHNVNHERRRTLTGKKRFRRMMAAYEKKIDNGLLPATYELITGHAWVPGQPRAMSSEQGLFRVSLERVRNALKKRKLP